MHSSQKKILRTITSVPSSWHFSICAYTGVGFLLLHFSFVHITQHLLLSYSAHHFLTWLQIIISFLHCSKFKALFTNWPPCLQRGFFLSWSSGSFCCLTVHPQRRYYGCKNQILGFDASCTTSVQPQDPSTSPQVLSYHQHIRGKS